MNRDKKESPAHGLFIPNRQLSMVAAGGCVVLFSVFMGGYFVGKNHMIEPLIVRMEDSSFADQVYTSLLTRYPDGISSVKEEVAEGSVGDSETSDHEVAPRTPIAPVASTPSPTMVWYAPLVGYPLEASARTFAEKLERKGIEVIVKKWPSTTAQGKKKYWYQVVTKPWEDREALQAVVDRIAREEKLKHVDIKEVKS